LERPRRDAGLDENGHRCGAGEGGVFDRGVRSSGGLGRSSRFACLVSICTSGAATGRICGP
jgi:hypothetical protein